MIKTKFVSSLVKALVEDDFDSFKPLTHISALKGERLSVQLLHTYIFDKPDTHWQNTNTLARIELGGGLSEYASMRDVCNVPVDRPTLDFLNGDTDYVSLRPGLFPDVLRPLCYGGKVCVTQGLVFSVWIEIDIPKDIEAGEYTLSVSLNDGKGEEAEDSVRIEVIDAVMPEESIFYTRWFHCDCLAHYYDAEVWSEKHWRIIENFARVGHRNGLNMLFTPVFTPPIDTEIGGERLTTQLVGVTQNNGEYSFDFSLVDRWVDMCDRIGIKYIEVSHLFTQWGVEHAPKIMATVDGEYKKIFGWETDARSPEYADFLRKFLTAFVAHMKARGDDKRCFYHISDEPREQHIDNYRSAKAIVADILKDYTVMDAISDYEFWKLGILDTPIPVNVQIDPFLENKVPGLWTYYCGGEQDRVSNGYIQMPSRRTRSIGFQIYKYGLVGFLQWGFNFYSNRNSNDQIDPYLQQDGNGWVPPGDSLVVYPARGGDALESIRIIVFHEALQDIKVMKLCEKYYGKDAVLKVIEDFIGCEVTFRTCAKSIDAMLGMRERLNEMLKKHMEG